MRADQTTGLIVILNGAPRSGKSSIVKAMQERLEGIWINLGVDLHQQAVPAALRPAIGLRPGGERPDIEAHLPALFDALYASVAAHSRHGFNVAVDIGHHDAHAVPLSLLPRSLRQLDGLPVLMVGVRCPLQTVLDRRALAEDGREELYLQAVAGEPVPVPILAWQREVHRPGIYDLELDTSRLSPEECCDRIAETLARGIPTDSAMMKLVGGRLP